ncbi:hypothetical protein [Streptomyces bicolor]|uniref:hypothetical protein n=1 Tax=Streptomyces bicolor TaxID=66874 RepID=UPI00055C4A76|nr:hypothetical protein [Streptomyces bicolor]
MRWQHACGSAEGFSVFAVDADWPESRQVTGHGYHRATGDLHVWLWFGSPHFDPQVQHVTVLSASSGNAETSEAWSGLLTFELWRNSSNRYWLARGCVESTELVLSGSKIEPSELSLVRVSDLTSFSNPFASLR